jgi:hypothetical protein
MFKAVHGGLYDSVLSDCAVASSEDSISALLRPRVSHVQFRSVATDGAQADIDASDALVDQLVEAGQGSVAAMLLAEIMNDSSARDAPSSVRADTARMISVRTACSIAADAAIAAAKFATSEAAAAVAIFYDAASAHIDGAPFPLIDAGRALSNSTGGVVVTAPPLDLSAPIGVSAWFKLHEADKPLTVLALPRRSIVITVGIKAGSITVSPQGNTVGQIELALVHHGVRVTSGSVTLTDVAGVDVRKWQHIAVVIGGSSSGDGPAAPPAVVEGKSAVIVDPGAASKVTETEAVVEEEAEGASAPPRPLIVLPSKLIACAAGSTETYAVYLNGACVCETIFLYIYIYID